MKVKASVIKRGTSNTHIKMRSADLNGTLYMDNIEADSKGLKVDPTDVIEINIPLDVFYG